MSASPYEPAPPGPPGPPAPLVNGRPMSARYEFWPDRRPLHTGRQTLWTVVGAALLMVAPFLLDPVLPGTWREWFVSSAFGTAMLAQAGMEVARPDPADRTAVVVYRTIHLGLPFVLCVGLLILVEPLL